MSYFKDVSLKPFLLAPAATGAGQTVVRERRREMAFLLSCSLLFSCLLAIFRVLHTGRLTFLFLIWNLFLAYVPYAISGWLTYRRERMAGGYVLLVLLSLVWLVTVPNTFYILTDLYHLGDDYNDRQVPQWFDLVMILSFAWNGLLLGVLSVRQMEKIWAPSLRKSAPDGRAHEWMAELLFVYPIMWLNALGVYTGRYLRYNSWEIVSNPFRLLGDIAGMVIHPLRHHYAWDMIFCFSILMTLMYLMMKRMSRALL
ncbi:MAG TPA: DUF1361 domain-containing protein [Puia sp.]|jgi:uncharacterized membrane protein